MVTERDFSSVFDYRSAFEYGPANIDMKPCRQSNYKSAFSYHAISISSEEGIEKSSKETFPEIVLRSVLTFVLYIFVLLSLPLSGWMCIKRIHSLERIVLMRLGRLQPIKGPGFAFVLPFVDKWTRVDLRPQNFTVETSQLRTADGGIVEAQTDIEYRVSDVLSYVLKLQRQDSTLRDLGLFCLRNIVSQKDQEDLQARQEFVNCSIKDELNRSTVNWGLEVVDVSLHSVKILKAPEAVNVIGTLMTALKAATGHTSDPHTTAVCPLIPDLTATTPNPKESPSEADSPCKEQDCVEGIRKITNTAMREGHLTDLNATFMFNIVGSSTRQVLITFEQGSITVLENPVSSAHSDVQLMLTDDNLNDFLNGGISPLEAYMDGKVMVTGDWSLLRSLSKIFHLCKAN